MHGAASPRGGASLGGGAAAAAAAAGGNRLWAARGHHGSATACRAVGCGNHDAAMRILAAGAAVVELQPAERAPVDDRVVGMYKKNTGFPLVLISSHKFS